MYHKHTVCRACGFGSKQIGTLKTCVSAGVESADGSLIPVLDLGPQPMANDFRKAGEEHSGMAPLKVMFCPRCSLAQLSVVVDPKILYSHYSYVTSNSRTMQEHFNQLANDIIDVQGYAGELFEIGANDGTLIRHFEKLGFKGYGIDPAENLCRIAREKGTTVHCAFFDKNTEIINASLCPTVILARHVFCHIDDWRGFMQGIENVASETALVCIEAPYVLDQFKTRFWDQIYHEHLSYLSVRAVDELLKRTDWHLQRIIHYPIHGGSLLLMLRHDSWTAQRHQSVDEYLAAEQVTENDWKELAGHMKSQTKALASLVSHLNTYGKRVVGYGAAAKSTVWINAANLDGKLQFVCDNTPLKQWTTVPGTDIAVVDDGALTRELPDYAILFAWNFKDEIIEKEKIFRQHGGKWIVPVPEINIV